MTQCLVDGVFGSSAVKQCEYIRILMAIFEELEKDVALGMLDLLKSSIQRISGFDFHQNQHIDPHINLVRIRAHVSIQ